MIKINEVKENLFTVTHDELESIVDETLKDISFLDSTYFNTEINDSLEDTIVSRIVSSLFVKDRPEYFSNNNLFIRISVPFKGRTVEVTTGTILVNNKEKIVNGVLYK